MVLLLSYISIMILGALAAPADLFLSPKPQSLTGLRQNCRYVCSARLGNAPYKGVGSVPRTDRTMENNNNMHFTDKFVAHPSLTHPWTFDSMRPTFRQELRASENSRNRHGRTPSPLQRGREKSEPGDKKWLKLRSGSYRTCSSPAQRHRVIHSPWTQTRKQEAITPVSGPWNSCLLRSAGARAWT